MSFLEWSNAFNIGIEEIDAQHRSLFDRTNELAEAIGSGSEAPALASILDGLERYAASHFAVEEDFFDRSGYSGAVAHKQEHSAFKQKVVAFKADLESGKPGLSEEMMGFLKSWLVNHISFIDRKYKPWFIQRGFGRGAG
jgi:hemerythrin